MANWQEWVRENRFVVGLGIAAVLAIVFSSFRGGDESDPIVVDTTSTTFAIGATTTEATTEGTVERPDIEPIACEPLLTYEETDTMLGLLDLPLNERGTFVFSMGERCTHVPVDDESRFVAIGPAQPSDFSPNGTIAGVSAVVVDGLGDAARWFGDLDPGEEGPTGVLSVFVPTAVGDLAFRIELRRTDVGPDEQLELATLGARAALPRFPGVVVDPPPPVEPEVFTSDPLESDPPPPTIADLARDLEAGAAVPGEGIVEALRFLVDQPSSLEVAEEVDIWTGSGTGVVLQALDALEVADDEVAAEIDALLATIAPPVPAQTVAGEAGRIRIAAMQIEDDAECASNLPWFDGSCAMVEQIGPVRFAYPEGALTETVGGWDATTISNIRRSIGAVVQAYSEFGGLPPSQLWVTDVTGHISSVVPTTEDGLCSMQLHTKAARLSADQTDFTVGMELAGCLMWNVLPREVFRSEGASEWWFNGMAVFLAAEAFPITNIEWTTPTTRMLAYERGYSLQSRSGIANYLFFRSIANGGGVEAAFDMIRPLTDAPSTAAQQDKLAAHSPSAPALHVTHQELTDSGVADIAGTVPYDAPATEAQVTDVALLSDELRRFGVVRYEVTIPDGMLGCVDYEIQGGPLYSWRRGPVGPGGGTWTFETPDQITGTSVFLSTTTEDGDVFQVQIEAVEDPSDCDEEDEEEPDDANLPELGCLCDPSGFWFGPGTIGDTVVG